MAIITSFFDDDLYKFTTGAIVHHYFPNFRVGYRFINRGDTKFPLGFDKRLCEEIEALSEVRPTEQEIEWLRANMPALSQRYITYLSHYRLDPTEVNARLRYGKLHLKVDGYWDRTIFWEVKLMAIISELYFEMTGQKMDTGVELRAKQKGKALAAADCEYIEFGTRRRFSYAAQDAVIRNLMDKQGFKGTSNPHFAMKYNLPIKGTYPHEAIMALSGWCGIENADKIWRMLWTQFYGKEFSVALTDTFTTPFFFKHFSREEAQQWRGLRQDSGCPFKWTNTYAFPFFEKMGVDTIDKTFIYSDGLTDEKLITLTDAFRNRVNVQGGIGTFFSNDVQGCKPLNMVIKLAYVKPRENDSEQTHVVKLSDEVEKCTGNATDVYEALQIIQNQ